ncbi:efflux RND transporter periplasmic adaptor subunit [Flavobacterium circumlabens]|uniref:Efflux RND transporter periplasmic adaptor subunit n=1 Tax=Flavobacterium circumlabens TaxID=2133765 RepID=A0A4Y7UJW7_9FLAO|nr:efflux RND transporter periplasmic adaptor subunit [Flavobacterium circumlabens]TCN60949.1 RND family efflux transporter MFP subunit [Flavobacterium circumlabens]TEB46068.1 efflux RND transporter periplasmic adaptor subunit [Flavobacterium circumlabens]
MKKTIITIVIIIAALGVIGYVLNNNKKENKAKTDIVAEKNAAVSVKVAAVKTEEISLSFVANGNFEPIQELTFSAEKSGKVISVLAKEGDYVRVGQTLLTVRGDVINVSAQQAQAVYQNAKADYARYENAFKTGGVTKQQLDQAKLALTNAQSSLTQANINVGDTKVKAPINGFINKKYIEPGSILAGMPATALFDIVNVSKLKLKVTVNESQVASLKLGNTVNITASVYPDKTFSGKITFIAAKADESLNFPVEIEIANNSDNDLKAGMYGTANFGSKQQKQNLMVVPRNAFVGSVSSNEIFVVEKGIAKLRKVTAGRILGDQVEIINGLSDGETVIVTGQINLQDGNTVEIIK